MKTHAPSILSGRGSLCNHACPGPFAKSADEVTCKRCLSFSALLLLAFERLKVVRRRRVSA